MARPRKTPETDPAQEWNQLDISERRRIRRLVRVGRPVETREEARLAMAFADYQRTRPWFRLFWFWFIPAVVVALAAATSIHPILVGIVLASAGSALLAHRNFKRVAKVNASLLDAQTDRPSSGAVSGA